MKEQEKRNPKDQQHESLRLGTETRLKESVKDAAENRGVHAKARNDRFEITAEPKTAPRFEQAQKVRYVSGSKTSGGKAVHAVAFDDVSKVPAPQGKRKK